MGYKIQYTPLDEHRYPSVCKRRRKIKGKVCAVMVVLLAALWFICNGMPDFLIPGDSQVTRAAVSEMLSRLKDGAPVQDAFAVFCRQVIDGAAL